MKLNRRESSGLVLEKARSEPVRRIATRKIR
jgi:hypothetical protein